jgi:hypothetical protein|tara:strand:+ start:67017 stop:67595 length:579 start_codon:yes stop_codon:yes gene_type:complete
MAKRSTIADPAPENKIRQHGAGFWLGLLALAAVAMALFSCVGTSSMLRTETDSGLEYQVLREAPAGAQKPTADDLILVHYEGRLADGTVFDSSYARGEPAPFAVSQVIPGFAEGLQLMGVDSKYRFFIPSELGYGATGAGDTIPPNADLMFEVELLGIAPEEVRRAREMGLSGMGGAPADSGPESLDVLPAE